MSKSQGVAAYAGAIASAYDLDTEVSVQEWDERVARAVMAVADAERNAAYADGYRTAREHWKTHAEAAEAESARLASVVELHKKALNVALSLVGIHPDLHTKDDREALEGCRMVLDDEPAALAPAAPDTATPGKADGAALIAAERQRQIDAEGYTPEHDAEHDPLDLVHAAQTYLRVVEHRLRGLELDDPTTLYSDNGVASLKLWPWSHETFKSTTSQRDLVKAGALIAAAIDRRASSADDRAGE